MASQKFLDEQCRYLFRMANGIKDDEKRFHFVHNHIASVEDCMPEGEDKQKIVKAMTTWALQQFNALDKYKSDLRMLDLWKLLGKYSEELKMEGVLENVHRAGLFNAQPAFYLLWAEHWAEQGNRRKFDRTVHLCETSCPISTEECTELFRPLVAKYFERADDDEIGAAQNNEGNNTMALIKQIAARPEDVRRDLTLYARDTTTYSAAPTIVAGGHSHSKPQQQPQQRSSNTVMMAVASSETEINTQHHRDQQVQQAPKQQQAQKQPTIEPLPPLTAAPPATSNREEFSIFRDPTMLMQAEEETTKWCRGGGATSTTTTSQRKNAKQQQQKQVEEEEEIAIISAKMMAPNSSNKKKPQQQRQEEKMSPEPPKASRPSMMFCDNMEDVTVSGAHAKFTLGGICTSTPRRSVAPGAFEDPILGDDMDEVAGGLLGTGKTPKGDDDKEPGLFAAPPEIGGSKLQRRLCLAADQANAQKKADKGGTNPMASIIERIKKSSANEITKAMPQLKIGSTIQEETEEFEKENTNSYASPDRKKKRQALPECPTPLLKSADKSGKAKDQSKEAAAKCQEQQQNQQKQPRFDPDESTHQGTVVEKIKPGTVNPWNEQKRQQVLEAAPVMVECHDFLNEKCPRIEPNRTINLGGESFHVEKLLGQGGFARVYKVISQDNCRPYAIKYEAPPCPWEVYICSMLKQRCPPQFTAGLMEVRDAYIFTNASAIVYDYYPCGTLLDLSNLYKKNGAEMGGLMATFFGIQLARTLQQVHEQANIIHADVKPDNVVLLASAFNERASLDQLLSTPMLKLIDWGRSIDMEQFLGVEFVGRAGTEHFDCTEMIMNKPWTFQTDFYGFCASVFVLMKGEYLVTYRYQPTGSADGAKIIPLKQLKRRMALYDLWTQLFDEFLNIPSCAKLPQWGPTIERMEQRLATAVRAEPLEWKKAMERFNAYMKQ